MTGWAGGATLVWARRRAGWGAVALVVGVVLATGPGCSDGAGPRTDSNSNWLSACLDDSDCPDKSHCICGVCTRTCRDVLDCEGLSPSACIPIESGSVDVLCGTRALPNEPVCLPVCLETADCDEGQECVEGACVVPDGAARRDAELCEVTGGFWDDAACGDYACGVPPACGEVVAGCDCGHEGRFDGEVGCVAAPECTEAELAVLCEDTGGSWVSESCGHWACGEEPGPCDLAQPGCNCGALRGFDPVAGCRVEDACLPTDRPDIACEVTGGTWQEESCGDYECGVPPACEDVIPGCDCGTLRNFSAESGCVADETCSGPDSPTEILCAETGGVWHPDSCGHYECGEPGSCDVPAPGCDCGDERLFEAELGCVLAEDCAGDTEAEALCLGTDGVWHEEACGHYACGEAGSCEVPEPGCDCGGERNFVAGDGCVLDVECTGPGPEDLCVGTDGIWVVESCGHWECGHEPTCGEPAPGCNCGAERVFVEREGCVLEDGCLPTPEMLCGETAGTWDPEACGHYECGEAPACGEVTGGCNCGPEHAFGVEEGCFSSDTCL